MSRPAPTSFVPIEFQVLGASRHIRAGAHASYDGEGDILANTHFLYLEDRGPVVQTVFSSDISAGAGTQPYVIGRNSASKAIHALWFRDVPPAPYTEWHVHVMYENTGASSPTDDGVVRFDIASDPWVSGPSGTFVDVVAAGGSGQWTSATGTLTMPSATYDTIRMWVINGASGEVRVHSAAIWPKAPTAVAAGPETVDGHRFVAHDTTEGDVNSGLTVHQRQVGWDNLQHIRAVRTGTVVGWSENIQYRAGTEEYRSSSATYELVIRLPFWADRGQTRLRWGLFGRRHASSSAGGVQLTTAHMLATGVSSQEVALTTTWSSPYSGSLYKYDDGGQGDLECAENQWNELQVYIKGDGTYEAHMLSLSVWFESVTA